MTYSTEFVDHDRGIVHIGSGVVTGDELIEAAKEDRRIEARARHLKHILVDFTDATELKVTAAEIRRVVDEEMVTAALAPGVAVAVAAPKDFEFGMARLWQSLVDDTGWNARIFRSRLEAETWLAEEIARHP